MHEIVEGAVLNKEGKIREKRGKISVPSVSGGRGYLSTDG
jgi:hypothetical protein